MDTKATNFESLLLLIPLTIFIVVIALSIMGIVENIDYIIKYKRGFLIFSAFFSVVSIFMWFCLKDYRED